MNNSSLPDLLATLESQPEEEQHWLNYIEALILARDLSQAEEVMRLGRQHGLAGNALELLDYQLRLEKLKLLPENVLTETVITLFNQANYQQAMECAFVLTTQYPHNGFGWKALGTLHSQLGDNKQAEVALRRALELNPNDVEVHSNLGATLRNLEQYDLAVACHRRALELQPDYAVAHNNLGIALGALGRLEESIQCFKQAIHFDSGYAEAYNNLGNAMQTRGEVDSAVSAYNQAIQHNPNYAEAHSNLGTALQEKGLEEEAANYYRQALSFESIVPSAHFNLGNLAKGREDIFSAVDLYKQAIKLNPDFADAYFNLGDALRDLGLFDEGIASYRQALNIKPRYEDAFNNLLFCVNYHPDLSSEEIYGYYQEFESIFGEPHQASWQPHGNDRSADRKLKVGYVSPSFTNHACRYFLEPLLAHHDKTQVEVYAYAQLQAPADHYTARYQSYADHWIATRGMNDDMLTQRIRQDGIDILIDVAGHTGYNRLEVFARKPAPVSLHWLDFGYTTGLKAIDYYLTDVPTIPAGTEHLFSEQPWRLATPAYAYRPAEGMGEEGELPALNNGYITFGTLTRAVRINYKVVRTWSAILKAIPNARLIINSGNFRDPAMQERMASHFTAQGIARERLEIGHHTPPWDVLRKIDIGLDCFPHNSGTTLFETLYMGIPYITLANRPSVGRLGTSILHGLGHPEWVADTEQDYIDKAIHLAQDTASLRQLRKSLRAELQQSPLMDEGGFTRAVETAYRQMWRKWCENN